MSSSDIAKDKAARLLKKRGSVSGSSTSNDYNIRSHRKQSMSTISFIDEPSHEDPSRPPVRMENTFQMAPGKRFPHGQITGIIKDVLEGYLAEEKYEPELCKQMTKTLSEVVKARVKELMIARYKIICIVHIGQLNAQAVRIGSRCLWESNNDTFASFEYRNQSLFALGTVYGIYTE
ncbi:hypothetical protein CAPTEDRAFT_140076 [Capitella teleta]|uniref:Tctex1 domain-containing protein 1 n=1 Tax=Capitella teleta TaxID=283909 RepID=R7TNJ1_CAPTE|nr:hypothetical protein CAPTEDRAFT_140076 [Capitella teleta]|eukprot:ELT92640.1 hypothetical protein CAPTEDRAFT_140076 [Capitella teleta]